MIPPAILAEIADCSDGERAVLWSAVSELLVGLKKGRGYGRSPGHDTRDYIQEARDELRDGLLYLAMHRIQRATAASPIGSEAAQPSARETAKSCLPGATNAQGMAPDAASVEVAGAHVHKDAGAGSPLRAGSDSSVLPVTLADRRFSSDAAGPVWSVPSRRTSPAFAAPDIETAVSTLATSWDDRVVDGSPCNVPCAPCGAAVNAPCDDTDGSYCRDRIEVNRLRLDLPEHDNCECEYCRHLRGEK